MGFIIAILLTISSIAFGQSCPVLTLSGGTRLRECKLMVESPTALKQTVYVKAWIPEHVGAETEVIVFLHGRGAAATPQSSSTMIENLGLDEFLNSLEYRRKPFVLLAPQDLVVQSDTGDVGQDYWLGVVGRRDWRKFLSVDLVNAVDEQFGTTKRPWKTIGVSMGAHGAMRLAMDFPKVYGAFAALSPVFRSTIAEISDSDQDVFLVNGEIKNNVGTDVLLGIEEPHLGPHYIRIHRHDSFLNSTNFPSVSAVWKRLLGLPQTLDASVAITNEPGVEEKMGHCDTFWRGQIPKALNWLSNVETKADH